MASVALQSSATAPHELSNNTNTTTVQQTSSNKQEYKPHDIQAVFNYYRDPGDGSLPAPNYANVPNSFEDKPIEARTLPVYDIRGTEDQYTLDKNGFQIVRHTSREKDFIDDAEIAEIYYPEVVQILKET